MEATLEFEMLKDTSVAEMVAEGATKELDDILDEVVNLAETMKAEKLIVDNMVADGEKAVDETDFAMQASDELELEIEVEDVSAAVGEISTPQGSSDQLTDMLSKKIEATIGRLVEERLSVIVERSIAEKLDTIFSSIG
jgi:hypothetical protein